MGAAGPDIADIDFDDLTSSKLTDVQRQVLEFTEAKRVELDIDRMLAEAIDQAGVGSDLDDADGFGDRLTAHIAAIEADDGLRELTRSTLRQRVVRLLRNRLSLTELIKRYPEIESIPIEKPFIVVGMPRSGTTHLVNLIAADPRRRDPLACLRAGRPGRLPSAPWRWPTSSSSSLPCSRARWFCSTPGSTSRQRTEPAPRASTRTGSPAASRST